MGAALERQDVTVGLRRVEATNEHLIKIVFELTGAQAMGDVTTETIWAEQLEANAFKVMNTPFHITGLSFQDVVSARPLPAPERLFGFDRVCERAAARPTGCSSIPTPLWSTSSPPGKRFEALGCSYEQAKGALSALYAIDVPTTADIGQVQGLLREGYESSLWDVEEGDCAHPLEAQVPDAGGAEA